MDIFTQGRGGVPKAGLLWWLPEHSRIFYYTSKRRTPSNPQLSINWPVISVHLPQVRETPDERTGRSAKTLPQTSHLAIRHLSDSRSAGRGRRTVFLLRSLRPLNNLSGRQGPRSVVKVPRQPLTTTWTDNKGERTPVSTESKPFGKSPRRFKKTYKTGPRTGL